VAAEWLARLADEDDLAEDTRVAVPIYVDPFKGTTRLWVTLGVRLTKLDARFVRAPRLKPAEGEGDWWFRPPWNKDKDRPSVLDVERLFRRHAGEIRQLLSDWLGDEEKTKEDVA